MDLSTEAPEGAFAVYREGDEKTFDYRIGASWEDGLERRR